MTEIIRTRLLVLAGLVVVGIAVAGVGTAFDVTEPLSKTGPSGEFVVSDENVTFVGPSGSETVVTTLTNVRKITIERDDAGQYRLHTSKNQPLTDDERERARTIAVTNDTVEQSVETMGGYELSVEPIQKLDTSASSQQSYDVVIDGNQTSDEFTIVGTDTDDQEDGAVTIERDPSYVEDRAVVRIRQPGEDERSDLKYTVDVDLANDTVTGITDWEEIRRDSTSINMTGELNMTVTSSGTS